MSSERPYRPCTSSVTAAGRTYRTVPLARATAEAGISLETLPYAVRVLAENVIRCAESAESAAVQLKALAKADGESEVNFTPARVLMQDFTGVPAVVDLAAMRDAMADLGGAPSKINPLNPVDLVIDHSVQVDFAGTGDSLSKNIALEYQRNAERYALLRSAQTMFRNFRVVPPGAGICHQVNLEYLAKTVWVSEHDGIFSAYPDTVVGTDSHTTMINGLAVLGWGVGGIEAESAMLGQPVALAAPKTVAMEITGERRPGVTATDVVLAVTQALRAKGVVGQFVEFIGEGAGALSLADRATIANMAPEYGATCGFFACDNETLNYLRLTARDEAQIALTEVYCKENGLWRAAEHAGIRYQSRVSLDLSQVEPAMAGPKRPQDRVILSRIPAEFRKQAEAEAGGLKTERKALADGDVVIAAITSCTNTSNPEVMIGAGLLARAALKRGLKPHARVKTSLAPGSQAVSAYLAKAGLTEALNALGFQTVGYGCTTCIGNSGPLAPELEEEIKSRGLTVAAVLSGNRNFEGRVHPLVKSNFLASPPLVVAYALAGNVSIDLTSEPLGKDASGADVYLRDIWPSDEELAETIGFAVTPDIYREKYARVFDGDDAWRAVKVTESETYAWDAGSTYIKKPPYFDGITAEQPTEPADGDAPVLGGALLALLGDSVTTDHISPAGDISASSPAAAYLTARGVAKADFNSYGARRGHDEVMTRGTFANVRLKNAMAGGKEGGWTKHVPTGEIVSIFEASSRYLAAGTPSVIVAGKDYGMGSSRDWAAKGTRLLGVKAVLAESFERIHRSNLIGMGVLPLEFAAGFSRANPALTGDETVEIVFEGGVNAARAGVVARFISPDGTIKEARATSRIDTPQELLYYKSGGILHKVLRDLAA